MAVGVAVGDTVFWKPGREVWGVADGKTDGEADGKTDGEDPGESS